jgi:dihydroflavonol-4-reductase
MKVLVTGATGFLGGWLVRRLLDEGHDVRIIKRPRSNLDDIEGLPLEIMPGDVTDLASLVEACRGVDSVFNLAGLIAYSKSQRQAMEKINVTGTANMIRACHENQVRRMVHLSSVVAVGASFDGRVPLDENSAYNVGHLDLGYFETKHKSEILVRKAVADGKIDAVMINPSTIYGRADSKKGSRKTQLKVAQGKFPIYPPGGVNIVAVEDVIDCIVAAWKTGRKGERYIISNENLLIKDAFEMIAQAAGVKPPRIGLPKSAIFAIGKVGDLLEAVGKKGPLNTENAWMSVLYHWFDSSKAQNEFGLKLKPASHAIEQSIRWSRDNGLLNPNRG